MTSTRKTSRKSPARKRTTARKARLEPAAPRPASRLPDVTSILVKGRRRDLDALKRASELSYEGVQTVVRRLAGQLKNSFQEWQTLIKVIQAVGPRESVSHLDEVGQNAMLLAFNGIRELADLAAQSQTEVINTFKRRIDEDLEELNQLLGKR